MQRACKFEEELPYKRTKDDVGYILGELFNFEIPLDCAICDVEPTNTHSIRAVRKLPDVIVFTANTKKTELNGKLEGDKKFMYPEKMRLQDAEAVKEYKIVSVANYTGGAHITANVRTSNVKWYKVDDRNITALDSINPLEDGYMHIAIYERM